MSTEEQVENKTEEQVENKTEEQVENKTEEQVRCSLCFGTCKIYIFGEYDTCYRCDGIGWYNKGYYIELDEEQN